MLVERVKLSPKKGEDGWISLRRKGRRASAEEKALEPGSVWVWGVEELLLARYRLSSAVEGVKGCTEVIFSQKTRRKRRIVMVLG